MTLTIMGQSNQQKDEAERQASMPTVNDVGLPTIPTLAQAMEGVELPKLSPSKVSFGDVQQAINNPTTPTLTGLPVSLPVDAAIDKPKKGRGKTKQQTEEGVPQSSASAVDFEYIQNSVNDIQTAIASFTEMQIKQDEKIMDVGKSLASMIKEVYQAVTQVQEFLSTMRQGPTEIVQPQHYATPANTQAVIDPGVTKEVSEMIKQALSGLKEVTPVSALLPRWVAYFKGLPQFAQHPITEDYLFTICKSLGCVSQDIYSGVYNLIKFSN